MKKIFSAVILLNLSGSLQGEDLEFTIKGEARDLPTLETLSPPPDIPSAKNILFSVDGGKTASDSEVIPLNEFEAALKTDPSSPPYPTLPLIPTEPFVVQRLPLGDKYDATRSQIFSKKKKEEMDYTWEFKVFDDENRTLYVSTGLGHPPDPLTWDGRATNAQFLLNPNRTYLSMLTVKTGGNHVVGSWPGEAVRFLGLAHEKENDLLIDFGGHLYKEREAAFSGAGRILLNDLARRLFYHIHKHPLGENEKTQWHVQLFEPAIHSQSGLAALKQELWRSFLESALDEKIKKDRVRIETSSSQDAWVRITLNNYQAPKEPDMRGKPSLTRPPFEKKEKWVHMKEVKNNLVVELRHDRLFIPGSAYLREEALDDLAVALAKAREENPLKGVVIRSYTEKVYDEKRNKKEEDPKLAALRTKVLFMLFAKERFLKDYQE